LQALLSISDDEIQQFKKMMRRRKRFVSTPLRLHLSAEEVAKFSAKRPYFQGVDIQARLVRNYPRGELTSHVIGYVARINEEELRQLDPSSYRGIHHIGKIGLEKTYEDQLHGHAGYEEIETNAQGRAINVLGTTPPTPGPDLYLSLDIDLQKIAYDALGTFNGAVVAIEVETGKTLVLASKPSFDPNPFVYGISSKDYKALLKSNEQPMFNRAIRGQYPPGSTIKPFMALAGLENAVITSHQQKYCPGFYRLPNSSHRYRDWKRGGHGTVDIRKAIVQSCDVYFYDLAMSLGIDRIHNFLKKFGFGQESGIDLVGEKAGLLPSKKWKRRAKNQPWYPGETLITGIGQGFTQVTPLQLARATAILANLGINITPHLVDKIVRTDTVSKVEGKLNDPIILAERNLNDVIAAMTSVVHGPRGTARSIGVGIPYQIAGKTGTAQVFTVKQEEQYDESQVALKLRDHALFIAFAPVDRPRIAIAVVVENGGHGGSVAAPIAAQVIKQYLGEIL
ncbi:MAG: penicillin-binding protein 2, partial [Pseudomonadota bacterium]